MLNYQVSSLSSTWIWSSLLSPFVLSTPANLWIHNDGWTRHEIDPVKRFALMRQCFEIQLQGYRTETDLPEEILESLPLFIDMVLIENIVDELECCAREGKEPDWEDIEDAAECLISEIPYAGIGQE